MTNLSPKLFFGMFEQNISLLLVHLNVSFNKKVVQCRFLLKCDRCHFQQFLNESNSCSEWRLETKFSPGIKESRNFPANHAHVRAGGDFQLVSKHPPGRLVLPCSLPPAGRDSCSPWSSGLFRFFDIGSSRFPRWPTDPLQSRQISLRRPLQPAGYETHPTVRGRRQERCEPACRRIHSDPVSAMRLFFLSSSFFFFLWSATGARKVIKRRRRGDAWSATSSCSLDPAGR